MPRREPIEYAGTSRRQENGRRGDAAGTSATVTVVGGKETVINALLVFADLVDTSGVAVDGTTTDVDNVTLSGEEIILRAVPGGDVDNGLWLNPGSGLAWRRYRTDLHTDGLIVVVQRGASAASTVSPPGVAFSGMRETLWMLTTDTAIEFDTDPIEFRQMPISDALKVRNRTPGTLIVPPLPGTLVATYTQYGNSGAAHLRDEYMSVDLGLGAVTSEYSGKYRVSHSILCSHATGGVMLGVGVYKNGVLDEELIRQLVGTADERHNGQSLVRVAGDDIDTLDIRYYDPVGAGFTLNYNDFYTDIELITRG